MIKKCLTWCSESGILIYFSKGGSVMRYPVLDLKKTGERIKELRRERNLKVSDIAEFMGFESEQAVYKWQRGDSLPTVDNLFALCRLFGTTVEDILIEDMKGEGESPLLPRFFNLELHYMRQIKYLIKNYFYKYWNEIQLVKNFRLYSCD